MESICQAEPTVCGRADASLQLSSVPELCSGSASGLLGCTMDLTLSSEAAWHVHSRVRAEESLWCEL